MTRRRRAITSAVVAATAAVALWAALYLRAVVEVERKRAECRRRLQNLQCVLVMYMSDSGRFPKKLETAVTQTDSPPWVLVCPSASTNPYERRAGQCDYLFADWSPELSSDNRLPNDFRRALQSPQIAKYPLLYERSLTYHEPRGAYVITMDGIVFWDEGGRWLREFAGTHPKVRLTLPQ